jgi:hypothetical protein
MLAVGAIAEHSQERVMLPKWTANVAVPRMNLANH